MACAMMSPGVCIAFSTGTTIIWPNIKNTSAISAVKPAAVWMMRRSSCSSLRPAAWPATTPTPTLSPVKKPTMQVTINPLEPTAAEASRPISLPTNIRSTVLYSCWIRLPRNSGMANPTSCLAIGPSVSCTAPLPGNHLRLEDICKTSVLCYIKSLSSVYIVRAKK